MGIRATAYLQVEPEWSWDGDHVRAAKVIRMTQRAPGNNQRGGTVLVKIVIDVPVDAFNPLQPAVAMIPEEMTLAQPIVEVGDPLTDST